MCEATDELKLLRAKLVSIGDLILAHDEDAGELASLELLAKIEAFVKDLSRPVKYLCLQGLWRKGGGVARIAEERMRQVVVEGWKPDHDDRHDIGELCTAAAAYLFAGDCLANAKMMDERYDCTAESLTAEILGGVTGVIAWPWEARSLKVSPDPVRNLEKAGALIAAEIDRLQRKSDGTQPVPTCGKEGV